MQEPKSLSLGPQPYIQKLPSYLGGRRPIPASGACFLEDKYVLGSGEGIGKPSLSLKPQALVVRAAGIEGGILFVQFLSSFFLKTEFHSVPSDDLKFNNASASAS